MTISRKALQKGAKIIEMWKVDTAVISLLKQKIDFLNERIAVKDELIGKYEQKDSLTSQLIDNLKEQKENAEKQKQNLIDQRDQAVAEMDKQNKKLRKQKRKTILVAAGTAAIAVGIVILTK